MKYPKTSKHLHQLYAQKRNSVHDYLHKVTRWIADYCHKNNISTVVIGDITGIRKDNDMGAVVNQKLHSLPYRQVYNMLKYKLALYGIRFVMQNEAYSSQCSPTSASVSKDYADPENRIKRGLYSEYGNIYNADGVGSYNIMRLFDENKVGNNTAVLSAPSIIKVAV